jgi:regulator of protease activity HflC (stomatin/prohibitin superfamily)
MTSKTILSTFSIVLLTFAISGCAVINQNEIGVKRTNGRLAEGTLGPGRYYVGPLMDMMILPIETINLEINQSLPSKEGLSVQAEISVLYRINPKMAHKVLRTAGKDYERTLILSSFRSAAADVCARFVAKAMHSGARAQIEQQIKTRMQELLTERGFIMEGVLLKSIKLPTGLANAIEQKLSAEQNAMRMAYVLQQEESEATRKKIEAEGAREANRIINDQLTDRVLRLRAIEAFMYLANSPNAKVIITNSTSPLSPNLQLTEPTTSAEEPEPKQEQKAQ